MLRAEHTFMIFVLFILAGLILGLATGGRLSHLMEREPRGLWLLVLAALINVFGGFIAWKIAPIAPAVRIAALAGVYGLVGWVLWTTPGFWRPALVLITLGGLLNFLVMAANAGQMPVDLNLLRAAGKPHLAERIGRGQAFRHAPLAPETPLGFLGDVIPLPRPFNVPSPGDLFLGVGLMLLVWHGVRTPSPKAEAEAAPAQRTAG